MMPLLVSESEYRTMTFLDMVLGRGRGRGRERGRGEVRVRFTGLLSRKSK